MMNLESTSKNVYDKSKAGNVIVRRTSKYCWAGLPCHLVNEQVLIRPFKSIKGLT